MYSRKLQLEDYEVLVKWWKEWGWTVAPSLEMLPPLNTHGVMICDEDGCICAGFVYETNSAFCWFTFPISDPKIRGFRRKSGVRHLIIACEELARELGFAYIYSSIRNPNMITLQKQLGFSEGGINHTELIKKIN
jgi:hypothetical protein